MSVLVAEMVAEPLVLEAAGGDMMRLWGLSEEKGYAFLEMVELGDDDIGMQQGDVGLVMMEEVECTGTR